MFYWQQAWATHFSTSSVTEVHRESAWTEVRKMFRTPTSISFLVGAFAEDGPGYKAFRDAAIYDEVCRLHFTLPFNSYQ